MIVLSELVQKLTAFVPAERVRLQIIIIIKTQKETTVGTHTVTVLIDQEEVCCIYGHGYMPWVRQRN